MEMERKMMLLQREYAVAEEEEIDASDDAEVVLKMENHISQDKLTSPSPTDGASSSSTSGQHT